MLACKWLVIRCLSTFEPYVYDGLHAVFSNISYHFISEWTMDIFHQCQLHFLFLIYQHWPHREFSSKINVSVMKWKCFPHCWSFWGKAISLECLCILAGLNPLTHTITDTESLSHSPSIYFFLFLSLSLPVYLDWAHLYTLIVPFFFSLSCVYPIVAEWRIYALVN